MSEMSEPTPPPARKSGWEHADSALDVAGRAASGFTTLIVKLYGLALIVAAVWGWSVLGSGSWWAALLLIGYGIYLLLPGSKTVVW